MASPARLRITFPARPSSNPDDSAMTPPHADLARLVARAAELRAAGASWDAVAAAVGRAADTCRRWPHSHPRLWRRAYRAAARQKLAEAGAEGLAMLRSSLRSEDEKVRRDAAKALARLLPRARPTRPAGARRPERD